MLRISTNAPTSAARVEVIRAIERELDAAGVGVESAVPLAELRTAVGDHILVLVRSLVAMAIILGVVGALGLGSALAISVVERTRELAVMRTLGATPRRVVHTLVGEGLLVASLSFGVAVSLSIPLTLFMDALIGRLGFLAPLPLVIAPLPALVWLGVLLLVACATASIPARRAASMSIREALART
jgi:putative ABC transport system permease protein